MSIASEITRINNNVAAAYTALLAKGATMPQTQNSAALASTIGTIPEGSGGVEEKDVNFYDYDGTLLHSYTTAEAQTLTALPELPEHEGLTAQGWNVTLAQIQARTLPLDVGATYTTSDGKTRFLMHIEDNGRITPTLTFRLKAGTAVLDWGDGSEPVTVTEEGSSYVTEAITHTLRFSSYPATFTVTLTVQSGEVQFSGAVFTSPYAARLTALYIGSGVESVTSSAFNNCYSLSAVTIPNTVTTLGSSGFSYCYNLTSVVIPYGVTSIGANLFQDCSRLRRVIFSGSVTSIGSYALINCKSLTSVTTPGSVTSVGGSAFANCHSLTYVDFGNATVISANSCKECYSLVSVKISNRIQVIEQNTFYLCRSLSSFTVPNSVTAVHRYTFKSCLNLSSFTLGSSMTEISDELFYNCPSLTSIVIPRAIRKIYYGSFGSCPNMHYMDMSQYVGTDPFPTLNGQLFSTASATPADFVILVSSEEKKTELAAMTNWSTYADKIQVKGASA